MICPIKVYVRIKNNIINYKLLIYAADGAFYERKLKEEYNHVIAGICREKMYLNTHICICDNKRIEVENCKRIMEYNILC
jgi:hypothetical protein